MKEKTPITKYQGDESYPSMSQVMSRRGALELLVTGSTVLGGLLVGVDRAVARRARRGGRRKVELALARKKLFLPCRYEAYKIVVETDVASLLAFLKRPAERSGIEAALLSVLDSATCKDVESQKPLERLNKRLGSALRDHYRRRTKSRVSSPVVTLLLRPWLRPHLPGEPPFP